MWAWLLSMLRNCTSKRYAVNKARMVPLAEYSRDCLRLLRVETGIVYDERALGTLQLFRTHHQLDGVAKDVEILKQFDVTYEILDRAGCIAAEPALASAKAGFVGGLRLPGDETGDCQLFTTRLAAKAAELGVRFSYGTELRAVTTDGRSLTGVDTSRGPRRADAYVLALGSYSAGMARRLGIDIPVYPVKGYSLTVPIVDEAMAPVSTVMDETYKTAITRLGNRIRVGGTAEVAGFDAQLRAGRRAALEHSFGELFPFSGDVGRASFWCGLRPMTPDGPPILGKTPVERLYLNTGHGTLGWTMACGSAKVLADIVAGNQPAVDVSGLGIGRYS
jgi:D-amino-acid dehydrogenase